jgi:hypothetical protein
VQKCTRHIKRVTEHYMATSLTLCLQRTAADSSSHFLVSLRQMSADGRRPRKRKRVQNYSPKRETIAQIAARAVKRAQELRTQAQFLAAVADAAMVRASRAVAECQELYEKQVAARTAAQQPGSQATSVEKGKKSHPGSSVVSGGRSVKGRPGGFAKGARGRPKGGAEEHGSGVVPAVEPGGLAVPGEGDTVVGPMAEGGESGRPKGLHLELDSGDEMEGDEAAESPELRRPLRGLVRPTTAVDIRQVEESAGIPGPDGIPDAHLEGGAEETGEAHPAYSLSGEDDTALLLDLEALLERERQLWKLKRVWGQDIGQQGLKMWPAEEIEAGGRLASGSGRSRSKGEGAARGRPQGSRKARPARSLSILSLEEDEDDVDFDPVNGPFFEGYKISRPRPRDLRVDVEGLDNRLEGGFTPQTLASVTYGAGMELLASTKGRPGRKKARATLRQ